MGNLSTPEITQLLVAWNQGDQAALDALSPLINQELHRLAKRYMADERQGHLLQPTALVNEAWLRLIDWRNVEWQNRAHFFGLAAQIMRRILVDFARSRNYLTRGVRRPESRWPKLLKLRRSRRPIWWRSMMPCKVWPRSMPEKRRWWSCASSGA